MKEAKFGQQSSFIPPITKRQRKCTKAAVSDGDKDTIRRVIHDFYITAKILPTLKRILESIKQSGVEFEGDISSLRKVIQSMGFKQGAAPQGVATKQRSDFPDNRAEPPPCVQNAMLTKDKKPFTYTPGGIDLSEIRSPRMARRLERNALSEGVGPTQQLPPGHQRTGPLPPSALAAMQPQLQVQVFPSGKVPQLPNCGPPPPPPPPMQAHAPLPLDNFERPDMTKIIPDNPMAMLRKTQGPVVKQDPILNKENYSHNRTNESFAPQYPTESKATNQVGSIYIPPVNQMYTPQSPLSSNQRDSPTSPIRAPPAFYKRQPSLPLVEPQSPPYLVQQKQVPVYDTTPQAPESPKPALSKAPASWIKQRTPSQEIPEWAVNEQRTLNNNNEEQIQVQKPKQQRPWSQKSLEKADPEGWVSVEQVKPEPQQWQQKQAEPQYRQQRQPESQAWQQRELEQPQQQPWQQKQPEPQKWQQREPEAQSWRQQPETQFNQPIRSAQSPPVHMPHNVGVRKQVQNRETPPEYFPNEKVEVVIVNEPPQIFHHPGQMQRGQRQQYPDQNQGVRIIPVQIEGSTSNGHGNSDPRSINRQLSWNSTPTQSNTFKVLQKITRTDADDVEDDQVAVEHSPKTPHNFPQQNVHRMNLNQGDQELVNKFKQDQGESLHNEIDPRYRGPHIPSKAFKFLQNMTGGPGDSSMSTTVPQEDKLQNRGPIVRTIPIQIEGNGSARTYVPPSEQTVSEPKKYMGSAIPSRSFKILQAMTAPDECANSERLSENNENYLNDTTMSPQWGHHPNYPMIPSPFPYYYNPYWNYYDPYSQTRSPNCENKGNNCSKNYRVESVEGSESESEASQKSNFRSTPVSPYLCWPNNDNKVQRNPRSTPTPVPFWPYCPPNVRYGVQENQEHNAEKNLPPYPYWDPYHYNYYYGVPPGPLPHPHHMCLPPYSPYPFKPPTQSDNDENSGYSSTDEMSYYGARFKTMPPFSNSTMKAKPPTTPSLQQQMLEEIKEAAKKLEDSRKKREQLENDTNNEPVQLGIENVEDVSTVCDSDSDTEMVGYEVCSNSNSARVMPSSTNICSDPEENSHCSEDPYDSESTSEDIDDSLCVVDEAIPHQLSVIFEESERTESVARYARENSVESEITDGTNTIENSDNEDIEEETTVFVKLPLKINFSVDQTQQVTTVIVGNSEVKPQVVSKHEEKCSMNDRVRYNSSPTTKNYVYHNQKDDSEVVADVDWWGHISTTPESNRMIEDENGTESVVETESEEEEVDFWASIRKDESYVNVRQKFVERQLEVSSSYKVGDENKDEIINHSNHNVIHKEQILTSTNDFTVKETYQRSTLNDNITGTLQSCEDDIPSSVDAMEETPLKDDNLALANDPKSVENNVDEVITNYRTSCEDEIPEVDFWAVITNEEEIAEEVTIEESESSSSCYINGSLTRGNESEETGKSCIAFTESTNNTQRIISEEDSVTEVKHLSIQERIESLRDSSEYKQTQNDNEIEVKITVKDRITSIEDNNGMLNIENERSTYTHSSLKLGDYCSDEDEEADSGVTSDISRHISEADIEIEVSEYKKINKYQRASTHSRLFKLLQDESETDIEESDGDMYVRRDQLNLPLQTNPSDPESFSSSGFTSPGSPSVNEKFVNELIQTLLMRKQGKVFKNMTMEKLHSAALRILQDDMDGLETLSSSEDGGSFLSPKKPGTGSSTPARTPQEFHSNLNLNEYSQYYETWAGAERLEEFQNEILPSKTFRLIQEHTSRNKTGAISGLIARCPRVLSDKNIQKELMRLIELEENSSSPDPSIQSPPTTDLNGATSAS